MTLTLTIIINVVLDIAILGSLALVMSRAAKLTPHRPSASPVPTPAAAQATRQRARQRGERSASRLQPALD